MAYKKEDDISYSLGAFPTMELLINKPKYINKIYLHKDLNYTDEVNKIIDLAKRQNIACEINSKIIERISKKDNTFIMAEFRKYQCDIDAHNQIVLHNPSDMGNVGTIMRTALGFDFKNVIMIAPCVDVFNPKVIRASMGAIFSLNVKVYDSFEKYVQDYPNLKKYLFMLDGERTLQECKSSNDACALVFGNEAHGLPSDIKKYGDTILIKHSKKIDSLNLAISASLAMFEFSK